MSKISSALLTCPILYITQKFQQTKHTIFDPFTFHKLLKILLHSYTVR